jgi:hypothetical protein
MWMGDWAIQDPRRALVQLILDQSRHKDSLSQRSLWGKREQEVEVIFSPIWDTPHDRYILSASHSFLIWRQRKEREKKKSPSRKSEKTHDCQTGFNITTSKSRSSLSYVQFQIFSPLRRSSQDWESQKSRRNWEPKQLLFREWIPSSMHILQKENQKGSHQSYLYFVPKVHTTENKSYKWGGLLKVSGMYTGSLLNLIH